MCCKLGVKCRLSALLTAKSAANRTWVIRNGNNPYLQLLCLYCASDVLVGTSLAARRSPTDDVRRQKASV